MSHLDGDKLTSASLFELTIASLRCDARCRKTLQIIGPIGSTAVAAVIQGYIKIYPSELDKILNTMPLCLIVFSCLIAIILALFDKNGPDTLKEAQEHQRRTQELIAERARRDQEIEKVRGAFAQLTNLYSVLIPLREFAEGVISSGLGDEAAQRKRYGTFLDLLVSAKGDLFGIKDEKWNFAIYIFNKSSRNLECVACRRRDRADEESEHRSWPPGDGHVGRAYSDAREYVADDVQKPGMRQFFSATVSLNREDDAVRYRSFAALPIHLNGHQPFGVVIATSDVPCRFWPNDALPPDTIDAVEPMRAFAAMLALIVSGGTLHASALGG